LDFQADPAHPGQPGYAIDGVYTMKFWVANRFGGYPGYFEAKISFVGAPGTQELCPTEGWATRKFHEVTLVCPSPAYLVVDQWLSITGAPPADPNAHIVISFTAPGWIVLFDNISLNFTPQS